MDRTACHDGLLYGLDVRRQEGFVSDFPQSSQPFLSSFALGDGCNPDDVRPCLIYRL